MILISWNELAENSRFYQKESDFRFINAQQCVTKRYYEDAKNNLHIYRPRFMTPTELILVFRCESFILYLPISMFKAFCTSFILD